MRDSCSLKIISAPNAFKESLSSREAAAAIKEGIQRAVPQAEVVELPLADGGDGMINAMLSIKNGRRVRMQALNPLGKQIETSYAILEDQTAIIEMSLISGLKLIPPEKRNALAASTYGMGQVICHAIAKGCRRFIVGIGGSATTDGGAGMAQALGMALKDKAGDPIPPGGQGLSRLHALDTVPCLPALAECNFTLACDVNIPLLGPHGAAKVYAPQ